MSDLDEDPTADLVRALVREDEPVFTMQPAASVRAGRRLVVRRRRRLGAGAALGAAAAVAAITGALATSSQSDRPVGSDTAGVAGGSSTSAAAEGRVTSQDYTVNEALLALSQESDRLLGPPTVELGLGTVVVSGADGARMPVDDSSLPSGMAITFEPAPGHQVSVSIARARGEAEGDPEDFCSSGLAAGWFLSCETGTSGALTTVVSISRVVPLGQDARLGYQVVVPGQDLSTTVPSYRAGPVSLQRTVKVIRSEEVVSYATEVVALDTDDPADVTLDDVPLFTVPPAALELVAVDPLIELPSRQLVLVRCETCDRPSRGAGAGAP